MRSVSSRAGHAALPLIFAAAVGGCTPAGSQTSTAALDAIGCQFESQKVCEQAMAHAVNFSSGITTSNPSYFQQNAPATVWGQVRSKPPAALKSTSSARSIPRTERWSTRTPHRAAPYRTATASG